MEGSIKLTADPSIVYNYQELLSTGCCLHCGKYLEWKLEVKKDDDRFCYAICCATRYSMVPEKVRVMAAFAFPLDEAEKNEDDEMLADNDFLKELQSIQYNQLPKATVDQLRRQGYVKDANIMEDLMILAGVKKK